MVEETKEPKMVAVVISAGYWAEGENLKHALLRLFTMGSARDHSLIFAYNASEDWDMNGFSIVAKKLEKIGEFKDRFSAKQIEAVRKAADPVEDIADEIEIEFERKKEEGEDVSA